MSSQLTRKTLHEHLSIQSDEKLQDIAKNLYFPEEPYNRETLIPKIEAVLSDQKAMRRHSMKMLDREYTFIKRMLNYHGILKESESDVRSYYSFLSLGAVFTEEIEGETYLVMPEEIYHNFRKTNLEKMEDTIENNSRIYNLLVSMVELYGVVSIYELIDNYNRFYKVMDEYVDNLNMEFFFTIQRVNNIRIKFIDNIQYFLHKDIVGNKGLLHNIMMVKKSHSPAILERRELLKYRHKDYYDNNEEVKDLKKFLYEFKGGEEVDQIVVEIHKVFKMNKTTDHIYDILNNHGIHISQKKQQQFFTILMDAYKNMRLWLNCGYTLNELVEMREEE
ncbi:MAG: hypothetical protein IKE59_08780 [Erysipelotrichaceae bacterium]|nr:hypothetical protein [Erysipelotrichaceae bacterium]